MPKRGQLNAETGLFFWRKNRGNEIWITLEQLIARRESEKTRRKRFHSKNPNYTPFSHTREQSILRSRNYRNSHKEKRSASFAEWAKRNKSKIREYRNLKYKNCPKFRANILARCSFRRGVMRVTSEQEKFCVEFLYSLSRAISSGGVKHVVDHILPIKPQGGRYCGLTNSSNLRVIPEIQNARKRNKCPIFGQQAQNAQTGRLGTAPASMGNVTTQGMQTQ